LKECSLCLEAKPLKKSHILPKNHFRDLMGISTKPRLLYRTNTDSKPTSFVQDGLKTPLLCFECEQRIGRYENAFKRNFFVPFTKRVRRTITYQEWLLKFAVSLSWRLCVYSFNNGHLGDDSYPGMRDKLLDAIEVWRLYLLDRLDNPGKYEQHIFPLQIPKTYTQRERRHVNESISFWIHVSEDEYLVYLRIQTIAFAGVIELPSSTKWRSSRISASRDRFVAVGEYELPELVSAIYLAGLKNLQQMDSEKASKGTSKPRS